MASRPFIDTYLVSDQRSMATKIDATIFLELVSDYDRDTGIKGVARVTKFLSDRIYYLKYVTDKTRVVWVFGKDAGFSLPNSNLLINLDLLEQGQLDNISVVGLSGAVF